MMVVRCVGSSAWNQECGKRKIEETWSRCGLSGVVAVVALKEGLAVVQKGGAASALRDKTQQRARLLAVTSVHGIGGSSAGLFCMWSRKDNGGVGCE